MQGNLKLEKQRTDWRFPGLGGGGGREFLENVLYVKLHGHFRTAWSKFVRLQINEDGFFSSQIVFQ